MSAVDGRFLADPSTLYTGALAGAGRLAYAIPTIWQRRRRAAFWPIALRGRAEGRAKGGLDLFPGCPGFSFRRSQLSGKERARQPGRRPGFGRAGAKR